MNLDFFFTFLHGHLELVLSVLKTINLISTGVDFLTKTLNLELHDIMLDESLLLLLDDSLEVTTSHLVFELEFTDNAIKSALLGLDLRNDSINVSALILQLLVRCSQKLQIFLSLLQVLGQSIDLLLQFGLLFFRAHTTHPIDLTLHLLNLEILGVDQLLLPLFLDLQLGDVSLQVT